MNLINQKEQDHNQHVLVVQLARLGDLIQTKRLMETLRIEGKVVHLCVDITLSEIAKIIYPYAIVHNIPAHFINNNINNVGNDFYRLCEELKQVNFSKVYLLNSSSLSYVLSRIFPSEIVTGYKNINGQDKRTLWSQIASRCSFNRKFSNLNLVDYWGFFHDHPIHPSLVNPAAKPANTHSIGIVVGGREARRSLKPRSLALILESLFQAYKAPKVILLGGKNEEDAANSLISYLPPRIIPFVDNLTGKTSLPDLANIIPSLDLVATPDTGLMHFAAHFGIPVMAFFMSSAWAFETGPYGEGHLIWQSFVNCAPCLESKPCKHNLICHNAFNNDNFIRYISKRKDFDFGTEWLNNFSLLKTSFDDVGQVLLPVEGAIAYMNGQLVNRDSIASFLGIKKVGFSSCYSSSIIRDADWIFDDVRSEDA